MRSFTPRIAVGPQTQRCMFCDTYIPLRYHGFSRNLRPGMDPCCDKALQDFGNHTVVDVLAKDAKFLDSARTLGASWYHATSRENWLSDVTDHEDEWFVPLVHLGTEMAAADRMRFYRWLPKTYMYKVRLKDDTVLSPDIFEDEDDWPETPDDLWDGTQAFRYVNGFEAVGSISLLVNPLHLIVEEVQVLEGQELKDYFDRMNPRVQQFL